MATPLRPIECSAQPLSLAFHPTRDLAAAGLVDGTVEIHDLLPLECGAPAAPAKGTRGEDADMEGDNDDEADTILASIHVAKKADAFGNTKMLARVDGTPGERAAGRATQGPSCRSVLFSRPPHDHAASNDDLGNASAPQSGGERLYTACNGGSLRCLDTERACSLEGATNPDAPSPILWSVENAHNLGINKLYQLPHSSPCGAALATGDDIGTVRLWDTRMCGGGQRGERKGNNPFDNLMKLPTGCIQHWKVNHDYITDFETNSDGTTLFASSADGRLSVFDVRFVNRKGTPRSVSVKDIDPHNHTAHQPQSNGNKSTWDASGYVQSDNQEDELLSLSLIKNGQKLLVGTQQGILSLFSYNVWGDISDRFPGHPQSIDALLKIDEDTVLTGSSDGLVRAVQLLPNSLLGVLGAHDGFPIEGLGWSAGRKMVGSVSHDEYIRLWDASFLNEDDDEEEEEGDGMVEEAPKAAQGMKGASAKAKAGEDSEDDWEDLDEDKDEEMGDSDDSDDSDGGGGGGKPKKREAIFKTANEEFFSDL